MRQPVDKPATTASRQSPSRGKRATAPPHGAPPMVVTLGLFRSASTWVFNVAAEILRRRGPVVTLFADDPALVAAGIVEDATPVVVKTHTPTDVLRLLVRVGAVPVILAVREPLDCVASFMRQFDERFEIACADVAASAEAALAILRVTTPLVLRYEAPRARGPATVTRIAEAIGVALAPEEARAIAATFAPKRVAALVEELTASGAFGEGAPRQLFDTKTHWHPRHIGSGRSGEHDQVLTPAQISRVIHATRPFRRHFGYEGAACRPPLPSGTKLSFAAHGLRYCEEGFAGMEPWGLWTEGARARLVLPLGAPARAATIVLRYRRSPVFRSATDAEARVLIDGNEKARILASAAKPLDSTLTLRLDFVGRDRIEIVLAFANLDTPAALAVAADPRRLGIGLLSLTVRYNPVEA